MKNTGRRLTENIF